MQQQLKQFKLLNNKGIKYMATKQPNQQKHYLYRRNDSNILYYAQSYPQILWVTRLLYGFLSTYITKLKTFIKLCD